MVDVTHHQRMQIKRRYRLTLIRMATMKKIEITRVGRDVKLEPLCTVGNVKWYSHCTI